MKDYDNYKPRMGTKVTKKPQPKKWKYGTDPRTHDMSRTFAQHKAQSNFRKEGWEFEFEDWKALWDEHWEQRGRGRNDYVMSRIDPDQPWGKDNVIVTTRHQSHLHFVEWLMKKRNEDPNYRRTQQ
jgi:hypothetical protein